MKTRLACLATLAILWTAPTIAAQEISAEGDPVLLNDISPRMEAAQKHRRDVERVEDMATLSQILYEDLLQLFVQDPHAAVANPPSALDADTSYDQLAQRWFLGQTISSGQLGQPLAEYLPGYGLVIQLQAPPPRSIETRDSPKKKPEEISRWEATRRRIRGEAVHDAAACTACHQVQGRAEANLLWKSFFDQQNDFHQGWSGIAGAAGSHPTQEELIAALASVLSEAGGRLRHIQPDERITLSVQYVPDAREPGDEVFLRRVYLDLIGELPTTEEVQSFLGDRSPEKRAKVIDDLLKRNGVAAEKIGDGKRPSEGHEHQAQTAANPPHEHEAAKAIDDLILHRLSRASHLAGGESPLPGRISVTATKRQIDALAAGATNRAEFGKQVVVRIFDPGGPSAAEAAP